MTRSNVVRLATRKPAPAPAQSGPRPVQTYYSGGGRTGHSKTVRRAIINAARRILALGELQRANVCIDGEVLADLTVSFGKVLITWRAEWAKKSELW